MSILLILILNGLLIGEKSDYMNEKFEKFIERYNKTYKSDPLEYNKRLNIFEDSLNRIDLMNSRRIDNKSAFYGITQFSDLTSFEFEQLVIRRKSAKYKNSKQMETHRIHKRSLLDYIYTYRYKSLRTQLKSLPQSWDWRQNKVVTPVRNQGKCGACWAYSTVETIESMVAMKTKKLQEYSIQQFIDCASEDNKGCDGGDTCAAMVWMAENKIKLQTASQYPMRDESGICRIKDPEHGILIADNFTCDNFVNKEVEIVKLLASHGPLVAAVDAKSWQHYLGGVIHYNCDNDLNHAVQIVGYDLTGNIPYYIVRNTWGNTFGVDGYLHIAIGDDLCGLAEEISSLDVTIV